MDPIYSVQNRIKQDRGLSKIRVVHNQNYKPHGTKSYVHLLHKYNFEPTKEGPYVRVARTKQEGIVPEQVKAAVGGQVNTERVLVKKTSSKPDAQHGDITAEDIQNDLLYLCKVSIGTPPQTLMVDFDTGSADFWVFSSALVSSQEKGHNVFNPKKSKTYKVLSGKSWKIQYGDGSTASGDCGTDTLIVGGLSVKNQTVEMAKKLSKQFIESTGDGLLGLAFSKINTVENAGVADPQPTPVENMIKQSDIPKEAALFTSAFYSWRDAEQDKSFYTFGYIDQDLVKKSGQEIYWADIDNSNGFWAFSSESVSINGESIPTSHNTAIADTGTTLTLMSDAVVGALYAQIPGATYDWSNQGYIFPITATLDDLPEFKVAVGKKEFLMQKEDLAFAPTDDGKNWYGGVQSRGSLPFNIYGDTFLRSVYAIWDQGNNRFGVVPKIEATQNLKPPPATGGSNDEGKTRVTSLDIAAADRMGPISVPTSLPL
ncbi:eukaryotic aspartyl protease [Xylariaceae sp. AK1471]|nr:eukaryotic aspartyl protease [Xylariaceae sp. AK1471]